MLLRLNSQAGVQKSKLQAGGSPKVAISGKTLAKGFKINTTVLANAENHNLVRKSEEISKNCWKFIIFILTFVEKNMSYQ